MAVYFSTHLSVSSGSFLFEDKTSLTGVNALGFVNIVMLACEGSGKGYSVNRSESTLILVRRKRDKDKTPVMSAILNHFNFISNTSFF